MASAERLGFIGIGIMGTAMVLRLRERGWPVAVWNREPEALPPVVAAGAVACASPCAVAEACDMLLLCVLDTAAVTDCVRGPDGIAAARGGATLVLDHSTIDPVATRSLAQELRAATGAAWIDAPVSGGPAAARAGTLAVMAGGDEADWLRATPVIGDLAANATRMGEIGAGQVTKHINQAIVGAGYVLMAEALRLAERAGIDAARIPDCLVGGAADSTLLRRLYPVMQQRAFDPPASFSRQLLKDLRAVAAFAQDCGADLPVVRAARDRYETHVANGHALQDSATIIRLYERDG